MRLIDADALADTLNELGVPYRADVQLAIFESPTIDAMPVKHGRWAKNDPHCDGLAFLWNCSECGAESDEGYRYCPACGARMDGDSDETDRR